LIYNIFYSAISQKYKYYTKTSCGSTCHTPTDGPWYRWDGEGDWETL